MTSDPIRILLVNPPHTGRMVFPGINDRIAFRMHDFAPPLGLLYLKSYLEKYAPARVRLFNFQTPERPTIAQLEDLLRDWRPGIVGVSVVSPFWYGACLVTAAVRARLPQALIVGGGPHMWTYPEETLRRGTFDIMVQGPGEKPLLEIVKRTRQAAEPRNIPGTVYLSEGQVVAHPPDRLDGSALDSQPFPDRTVLDIRQHRFSVNRHNPCALMVASRGCPYHCSFCNNRERYFLPRNSDQTVTEMASCRELGYRSLQFCDDVFTFSREHTLALCREIKRREFRLPWSCQTRVDCVDRELLGLMAEAGCERVQFGIESASPYTLDRINKGIRPEQIVRAFSMCREAGIITVGNFIIGFPWETMDEINRTFDFVARLDADFVFCNPLIPFPGTRIFQEACADPRYDRDWFKRFVDDPSPSAKIALWTPHLSEAEICRLIKKFYRQYYFNPHRMGRYLSNLAGMDDILGKLQTGLKLMLYR